MLGAVSQSLSSQHFPDCHGASAQGVPRSTSTRPRPSTDGAISDSGVQVSRVVLYAATPLPPQDGLSFQASPSGQRVRPAARRRTRTRRQRNRSRATTTWTGPRTRSLDVTHTDYRPLGRSRVGQCEPDGPLAQFGADVPCRVVQPWGACPQSPRLDSSPSPRPETRCTGVAMHSLSLLLSDHRTSRFECINPTRASRR